MKKIITLLILGCLLAFSSTAQNVVFNASPSATSGENGETITVDITVENFVDMVGLELQLDWNSTILEFQNITTYDNIMCEVGGNPAVCFSYPGSFGPANITDYFVAQYLDNNLTNPTLNTIPDGGKLLTVEFLVVGGGGQSTDIEFGQNALVVNSALQELSTSNGMLTANNATFNVTGAFCAGAGDVTFTASDESGETGTNGVVQVSVANFDGIEGFGFDMHWEPSVIAFDSISGIDLDGLFLGNFGTNQAVTNGNLFVSFDNSAGVTVCDGQVIFEIHYTVIGAGGTNTAVDFTGNIEVIRGTLIDFVVNSGSVAATGNGAGINGITFTSGSASPENGDQICIPYSVGNFDNIESIQYDMAWDETVLEFTSIVDANGQPLFPVLSGNPLGLLPSSFNSADAVSDGVIYFSWDNSAGVTVDDNEVIYQVCFDVIGETGDETTLDFEGAREVTDADGLVDFNSVEGTVNVTGVFNGLTLGWDCCELAQTNGNVCIDVEVVDGFQDITFAQYGMIWNPAVLEFTGFAFENGNPLSLSPGSDLIDNPGGEARMAWDDPSLQGVNLAPGTSLYQVCFDVIGNAGTSTDLELGALVNSNFVAEVGSTTSDAVPFLGNSCNVTSANIADLTLTPNITAPSCVDAADGAIDLTVSGGVVDYTFAWSTNATTEDITDLIDGTYTVTVTDCRGTTVTQTFTVTDPTAISITGATTNTTGAGNDGAIDLTVSGGTTPHTFLWSNGETTEDLSGLVNGTYTVTVTDANLCTATESFTIIAGCASTNIVITETITNASVLGNDGAIDIEVTGGLMPYTYAWSTNATTEDISGLVVSTYTVTVTDANGCQATGTYSIIVNCGSYNISITGDVTGTTGATGNNGAVDITVSGGATPYIYAWSNSQTTEDISGLTVGTYTVTVTDANGCAQSMSFDVPNACTPITISALITPESSAGNDGAINASSTGGTALYTYIWSPETNGGDGNATNLTAGTYNVTATDANGCTATNSFVVDAFNCPVITASATGTDVTCAGGNDGTAFANAIGGATPYTYNWGVNGTGQNISGLSAGTYVVTVSDVDNCQTTASVTIQDGASISVNVTNTNNLNCFNDNSGSITIAGAGGTAPYTATWNGGLTGLNINNLSQGTYTPTVTDANGCSVVGAPITLTQPTDITIEGSKTDVSCNGGNDGSIALNITGGAGGYNVTWNTGNGSNLSVGTYTPTVTDANGCVKVGNSITINQPTQLAATANITNATCAGESDGSITLNVTGGTAGYTVNWSNGASGLTVNNLGAGNITATIFDANGCSISEVYTITAPIAFTVSLSSTPETPAGGDGTITTTVTPAGSNYSYNWATSSNNSFSTAMNLNNLSSDIYMVTVTDNTSGCTVTDIASITNGLGIQSEVTTNVTCAGGADGSIEIITTGDAAPYTWVWTGPNNYTSGSESIFGLRAGTYTVTITDSSNATLVRSYTLTQPDPIVVTLVSVTHETDVCNGRIDIDVTGGTGPYTYIWNTTNGQGNTIIVEDPMDLCEGNYNVTVKDANDCSVVSQEFVVNPSSPQVGNITSTDVSCNGENDGTLTVTIVGGNEPYQVMVLDNAGGTVATQLSSANVVGFGNISEGSYTIKITDSDGLEVTSQSTVITEPAILEITNVVITNQSPTVCDGSITISATGGQAPYTYVWSNGFVGQNLTMLCAGTYNVTITDANGCFLISPDYVVEKNIGYDFEITPVACFGEESGAIDLSVQGGIPPYTYSWTDDAGVELFTTQDITNVPGGSYGVMISDASGAQVFSGMLNIPMPAAPLEITQTLAANPTIPTCVNGSIALTVEGGTAPYNFIWENATGSVIATTKDVNNLIGGDYFVTITDANLCTTEAMITLADCTLPLPTAVVNDISCAGECDAAIEISNPQGQSPHTYLWNTGATTKTIEDLCEGEYEVSITDNNGVMGISTFTIIAPEPIQVMVEVSPGRAEAIVVGGTAPYLYQWGTEMETTESFVEGLKGGLIALQVTDNKGCQGEIVEKEVPFDTDCLTARSVISPNDDGRNDEFYVNCVGEQDVRVIIFNRWGQEVFQSDAYDNSWRGTDRTGQDLPEGGYFYILEYDENGAKQTAKGSLSIIR